MVVSDDPHQLVIDVEAVAPARDSYRVVVRGEIDMASSPDLADALDALIEQGARVVVLDAKGVDFLDSSGLRVIVNGRNRLVEANGTLTIAGMSGAVQRILEVSGLLEQYRAEQSDQDSPIS